MGMIRQSSSVGEGSFDGDDGDDDDEWGEMDGFLPCCGGPDVSDCVYISRITCHIQYQGGCRHRLVGGKRLWIDGAAAAAITHNSSISTRVG